MVKDAVGINDIERTVRKRQLLGIALHRPASPFFNAQHFELGLRRFGADLGDVDGRHLCAVTREQGRVSTRAGANLKHLLSVQTLKRHFDRRQVIAQAKHVFKRRQGLQQLFAGNVLV